MKSINFIFFFAFCFMMNNSNDQYKKFDIKSIKLNSYVFYEIGGPGFPVGDTPVFTSFKIECKNGKLKAYEIEIFYHSDGKKKLKREVKLSKKKYLKLWKKILKTDLWNLKTVTPINLLTEEDLFREYKELRMEMDNNKFEFRLGKISNKFEVYDLPMLKNSDYLIIAREILALFKIKLKERFFLE